MGDSPLNSAYHLAAVQGLTQGTVADAGHLLDRGCAVSGEGTTVPDCGRLSKPIGCATRKETRLVAYPLALGAATLPSGWRSAGGQLYPSPWGRGRSAIVSSIL